MISELLDINVLKILTTLKFRGINTLKYKTSETITILIYLPCIDKVSKSVLVYFRKELYLVDSLRAKILKGNVIIYLEGIIIHLSY